MARLGVRLAACVFILSSWFYVSSCANKSCTDLGCQTLVDVDVKAPSAIFGARTQATLKLCVDTSLCETCVVKISAGKWSCACESCTGAADDLHLAVTAQSLTNWAALPQSGQHPVSLDFSDAGGSFFHKEAVVVIRGSAAPNGVGCDSGAGCGYGAVSFPGN